MTLNSDKNWRKKKTALYFDGSSQIILCDMISVKKLITKYLLLHLLNRTPKRMFIFERSFIILTMRPFISCVENFWNLMRNSCLVIPKITKSDWKFSLIMSNAKSLYALVYSYYTLSHTKANLKNNNFKKLNIKFFLHFVCRELSFLCF
jgi:hypothetical protein